MLVAGSRESKSVVDCREELLRNRVILLEQPVGYEQSDAIDNYDRSVGRLAQCFIQPDRLFDSSPVWRPFGPVPDYTFLHFVVKGLSSGDETNRWLTASFDLGGEPEGKGALTGSGAAEYENSFPA